MGEYSLYPSLSVLLQDLPVPTVSVTAFLYFVLRPLEGIITPHCDAHTDMDSAHSRTDASERRDCIGDVGCGYPPFTLAGIDRIFSTMSVLCPTE